MSAKYSNPHIYASSLLTYSGDNPNVRGTGLVPATPPIKRDVPQGHARRPVATVTVSRPTPKGA